MYRTIHTPKTATILSNQRNNKLARGAAESKQGAARRTRPRPATGTKRIDPAIASLVPPSLKRALSSLLPLRIAAEGDRPDADAAEAEPSSLDADPSDSDERPRKRRRLLPSRADCPDDDGGGPGSDRAPPPRSAPRVVAPLLVRESLPRDDEGGRGRRAAGLTSAQSFWPMRARPQRARVDSRVV